MMTYEDSPMKDYPPDWGRKILHATFVMGDHKFSGSDAQPGHYEKPRGFAMLLSLSEAAEADRIFNTLSENGVVQMPLQETFWALRYGELVDRFGTPWSINCEKQVEEVG
jgi:PhnB protein